MKKLILILVFFCGIVSAQNVISAGSYSGSPTEKIAININVANADPFTAFQTDIQLPSEVRYVNNSAALTDRKNDHAMTASLLDNNLLRIVAFSMNKNSFSGNDGAIVSFEVTLKSEPGIYNLTFSNTLLSNSLSQNILTGSENGYINIIAPKISRDDSTLNFGRVPLLSSNTQWLRIKNIGTSDLLITRIYTDNQYYEVIGDTAFNLLPAEERYVQIKFNSVIKGTYNKNLYIESGDFGSPKVKIPLSVVAFAVNEIHLQGSSGRSGTIIELKFSINNMEQFTGFQFELNLPGVLQLQPNGAELGVRKVDHVISANTISNGRIRVIAFSPTNKNFTGTDGEMGNIKFLLDGSGGWYYVDLNNSFITNIQSENIISASFDNYVSIDAPDISGQQSIELGSVAVTDTITYDYYLSNWGNDTLKINSITFSNSEFWLATARPSIILPSENSLLKIKYHSTSKGNKGTKITIRNNDPDEEPFIINLSASTFIPNFLKVQDAEVRQGDDVTLSIDADNYESIYALQFDIQLPDSLKYLSAELTARKQDHVIGVSQLTSNTYRVIAYSLSMKPFLGNSGAIVQLKAKAGKVLGTFPIDIKNSVMSNINSQNIIQSETDGTILFKKAFLSKQVNYLQGWNMISIPVIEEDMNKTQLFPTALTNAFVFDNGYTIVNELTTGKGYWIKLPSALAKGFWGEEKINKNVYVIAGWNLIGLFDNEVETATITTEPQNIISTNFFSFSDGYIKATTLLPGKGYWIKVSQNGVLRLDEIPKSPADKITFASIQSIDNTEEFLRIHFTNNNGKDAELMILSCGDENIDLYELPPMPPSGIFDVRFASNRFAERFAAGQWQQVLISSNDYPVTVSANNISLKIRDISGAEKILRKGENYVITNPAIDRIEISPLEIPTEYQLLQNYPNPFNPTTTIKFALPEAVRVCLEVYNVLGEKVAELINSELESGYHEIKWNCRNEYNQMLASGVYICQIKAGNYVNQKKMILLK